MDKSVITEPQWVLDRRNSGSLFWRRDHAEHKSRVKFRCDVQVKEFDKHEEENADRKGGNGEGKIRQETSLMLGMTAFFCVMTMILLPWYVLIVRISK